MSSELQAGEDYAIEHRAKLAEELLSWRKTGRYEGSYLLALAYIIQPIDHGSALEKAKELVIDVSLKWMSMKDSRQDLARLITENGLRNTEAAILIESQVDRTCSERSIKAWLAEPGKTSSRTCPEWAVIALRKAISSRSQ